jgi:FkbM family methyltransferase
MSAFIRSMVRDLFHRVGFDVHRYRPPAASPASTLLRFGVEAIFDIGANIGTSGIAFRAAGFQGPIVSFEPVAHLFDELSRRSQGDPLWRVEALALGASPGLADINVTAGLGNASSLLAMTDNVRRHAPDQQVIRSESVRVSTVDEVVKKYYPHGDRLFLKIDVQGYERHVLEGSQATLPRILGLKLELSLVENYSGESLLVEMLPFLYSLGFRAVTIEPAWINRTTGEIFQVDLTCFRTDRTPASPTTA